MIYSPAHYKEERPELIFDLIQNYGFATLITQRPEAPFISHLPLLLDFQGDKPTLLGHCARANPHWKHFSEGQRLTALFHGPHAYISPAWYAPKDANVPTWNYVTVHVQGIATIFTEAEPTYEVLQKITQKFETEAQTGWTLPAAPNADLQNLLKAIVAFRIQITDIQAKFKLSQKQSPQDRENVIEGLKNFGDEGRSLADWMSRTRP